jgi:hypothetical protein
MTLDDVHTLLALCLSEMPARHPKPRLVVHESPESLVAFMGDAPHAFRHANAYPAALVMGMADAARNAIHIPYTTIVSEEKPVILDVLLHEIGHLYQAQKHGNDSAQYLDEGPANAFSRRWIKRLRKKVS